MIYMPLFKMSFFLLIILSLLNFMIINSLVSLHRSTTIPSSYLQHECSPRLLVNIRWFTTPTARTIMRADKDSPSQAPLTLFPTKLNLHLQKQHTLSTTILSISIPYIKNLNTYLFSKNSRPHI